MFLRLCIPIADIIDIIAPDFQLYLKNSTTFLKQSHNIGKQYCPKAHTSCITTYI